MRKNKHKDYLVRWRERRKLTQTEVDRALNLPEGTIHNLELHGFAKTPGKVLISILCFYRVPLKQIYNAIEETKRGVGHQ